MTMEKLSLNKLWEKSQALVKRFPLAMIFIVILTIFILVLIHTGWEYPEEEIVFFGLFYLPTSALIALSFHLLNEEVRHKLRGDIVEALVLIGWLLYCGYLTNHFKELENADSYLPIACVLCIIISIFALSFYYQKNDIPFWRFSMRLLRAAFIAWLIGGILTGGIALLFESFRQLFGWSVPEEAYASAASILMTFVSPVLFLLRIPRGKEKQDDTLPSLSKFYKGVIYFLFVPLLMCYLLTLYLYAVVILIDWELPNGWVSWLTTFLMSGMLIVIFMIYPQQLHLDKNDFERLIARWLPIMVLPILILMSIGIYRRITDYGISIDRLYLLLFNVWCYIVCITLFLQKSQRIWWIPVSFCILLYLTSIGPWSFTSVTKRVLLHEVEEAMVTSGETLPMDKDTYKSWVESLPEDKLQINDKLYYLSDNYGNAVRCHLVVDSVWTYKRTKTDNVIKEPETPSYEIEANNLLKNHPITIPEGFDTMEFIETSDMDSVVFKEDSLLLSLDNFNITLSYEDLIANWDPDNNQFFIQTEDVAIVMDDVLFDREKNIFDFNGIIFRKKHNN